MFNKIVHASDGSKYAFEALILALAIARQNNSELHIVCVEEIPYVPEFIAEVEATAPVAQKIQEIFQRARAIAQEQNVTLHTHAVAGHPVRTVVKLAADLNADLLVIGARGHSALYERMVGSKAHRIVHLAPCPVLVVKLPVEKSDNSAFKRILHANDGSKYGVHALTVALGLAQQNNAELHMVCVEEIPYLSESVDESREMAAIVARRIEGVFQRARARAEEYRITLYTHLLKGHPVKTIVQLAGDLNVDLLIVGVRGHSALYVRMIGSHADRIMQLAPCPVLVAK